jgi:hypothetical protein
MNVKIIIDVYIIDIGCTLVRCWNCYQLSRFNAGVANILYEIFSCKFIQIM